jgi:hypothetical protein
MLLISSSEDRYGPSCVPARGLPPSLSDVALVS